jgi:hypothetical protein
MVPFGSLTTRTFRYFFNGFQSPELERLMDGIKAQLAEKEYQRMVSNIDPDTLNASSIASGIRQDMKDMKEVKAHAIGIVNVLYTGAAVFTAVFMISAHFTEDLGMVCCVYPMQTCYCRLVNPTHYVCIMCSFA